MTGTTVPTTRIASADAAWLRMDSAANPMVITAILWLEGHTTRERAERLITERLLDRHPRFRQRPRHHRLPGWADRWVAAEVDLSRHLVERDLPDDRALQDHVSRLLRRRLPLDRPLWSADLVHLPDATALVYRIHHSVADGLSLARLLVESADESQSASGALADVPAPRTRSGDAVPHGPTGLAVDVARSVAKLTMSLPDHHTVLRGTLGGRKYARWIGPFPLDTVKRAGATRGASVNDILVAAVTGGLRSYLHRRGSLVDDLRVMVPFDLRGAGDPGEVVGNDFGLVLLSLPLGITDAEERLAEVRRRMLRIKHSTEPPVSYGILQAMGHTPVAVERGLIEFFAAKASAVVTNVPGPREPLHLDGQRILRVLPLVPQAGHIGTGVSILSYAGEVTIGLNVDARQVPDPDVLTADIDAELGTLLSPRTAPSLADLHPTWADLVDS